MLEGFFGLQNEVFAALLERLLIAIGYSTIIVELPIAETMKTQSFLKVFEKVPDLGQHDTLRVTGRVWGVVLHTCMHHSSTRLTSK